MLKVQFLILMLLPAYLLFAQNDECKVIKPEISGTYTGGCKKGLAQGNGIAQGTDRYEGQFKKGLPNGRGTYKWANGVLYEGQWKNGMREGSGKMVYPDSVVTGFWKEDRYLGQKLVKPYIINRVLSVSRYTVTKTADINLGIKLRLMQGGSDNVSIEGFSLAYDSGSEYVNGNYYGLENVNFPLTLKVKYRSWNQLRTSQYDVSFDITINEPGSWNINLFN